MSDLIDKTKYRFLGISEVGEHLYKLRGDIAAKTKDAVDIRRKGGFVTSGIRHEVDHKEVITPLTTKNFIVGECGGPILTITDKQRLESMLNSFGVDYHINTTKLFHFVEAEGVYFQFDISNGSFSNMGANHE